MSVQDNDNFFKTVLDSIEMPVLVVGPDFRLEYLNRAAQNLFDPDGRDHGDLFCYTVTHQRNEPCFAYGEECPLKKIFATGNEETVVHQHKNSEDEIEVHEIYATPIFDETGQVVKVVETLHTISSSALKARLDATDQQYKAILQSTPDAVITINSKSLIVMCNQAVKQIFGHDPEALIGSPVTVLMPEQYHEDHPQAVKRAAETGVFNFTGRTLELTGQRKDGMRVPLELSLSTWTSKGERYFTAVIRDISLTKAIADSLKEEKRGLEAAQDKILAQHEEFQGLFHQVELAKQEWEMSMDCISDMVILADAEGRIKRCNSALVQFVGRTFSDLLGLDWKGVLSDQGLEVCGWYGDVYELFHKSSGRWFVRRSYTYHDHTEHQTGMVVTLHDTTEFKKVTEALEQKNQEIEQNRKKLQNALDEISRLIEQVVAEKQFDIRFNNPHLKICWKEMQCGQQDCPCYGRENTRCWQIAGTFCGGEAQGELAQKLGNCLGCKVYRECTLDPIYLIGEQFNNMMHIIETKHKQLVLTNAEMKTLMQVLTFQKNELEAAYSELKSTHSKLLQQEKMASIGQLAAGVAHEINNPVGFVTSNLNTLAKYTERLAEFIAAQTTTLSAPDNPAAMENLNRLRKSLKIDYVLTDANDLIQESLEGTDRIKTIVMNLKNFSRVDQAEHKVADLNECLESTISIVWNEIKYKAVLHRQLGKIPLTKCYPQQLNQVFMNLLVNAAQAIKEKGEITVSTRRDGDFIYISVADTGSGIPPEHINRIFEPFFTTKDVGKGTGLGLSIAYDIVVKKHEGDITVQSEPGKGTTFTVKIPIKEASNE